MKWHHGKRGKKTLRIDCLVNEDFSLAPVDASRLKKVQAPGQYCVVDIDPERQRSTVQLAKYWSELNDLCENMREEALQALLVNLVEQVSRHGKVRAQFIHDALKQIYGIDSIALSINSKEARAYFDFAFPHIENMKAVFLGNP